MGRSDPNSFGGGIYDQLHTGGSWGNGTARVAALTAIASKADLYGTQPSTALGTASSGATDTFVIDTEKARQIGFSFMVVGADGSKAAARIWGWKEVRTLGPRVQTDLKSGAAPIKLVPFPLVDITFLGGAKTVADNQSDPLSLQNSGLTWRYVDTITVGTDYTIGATADVYFEGLDVWSMLVIDPSGFEHIEIECTNDSDGTDTTQILPFYCKV